MSRLSSNRADLEALLLRAREPSLIEATGQLYARGLCGSVTALTITAGADAATATLRDGGSGGTIIGAISAPAGESRWQEFPAGFVFRDGLHVTLTGTDPDLISVGVAE